ncbi:MAG: hypothetical protein AAGI12_09580 [Pseudomonadota bacterium]
MADTRASLSTCEKPVAAGWSTWQLLLASGVVTGIAAGAGLGGWAIYGGEIHLAYLADAIMRCF